MLKRSILIGSILLLMFLLAGELIGRYYGLTSFPLYQASDAYEYIHVPNQKVKIYGKLYQTNEYSMRSKPLSESDSTVILLIGDSLVNGGNATDQDSLASTILENQLSHFFNRSIRVLNIAEGSWGPDNAAAYIQEHGVFNADLILLVFSSADAFDNMKHEPVVGVHGQYPDKQASLAWEMIVKKGWGRVKDYLSIKADKSDTNTALKIEVADEFNPGFQKFKELSDTTAIPLHFYLHVGQDELQNGRLDDDGSLIIDFCQENGIPYTIELGKKIDKSHYMDKIHYNDKGQKFLADNLFPIIKDKILERSILASTKEVP
ncbi:hypothetical protein [Cesiribacter sp. SM1]|uniref:hypothetical protein n=1 Tax=Cesiribacter sp. SM1 TaxID=2861196 RepID=UPI001CD716B2|nr:hypothetical protein [Cesiribacter sp. SM1]